jgi:hypothetical protein
MKAQEPLHISSDKYNHQFISAKFFDWEKCSIMLWIYIPPQGECIRSGKKNSYIISHIKGDTESKLQQNLFAVRYSPSKNWELVFTNEKGAEEPESIAIKDGLSDGWHHFLVSWDKIKHSIRFCIDGGKSGENISRTSMNKWVTNHADNVVLGAWVPSQKSPEPYPESYCNTMIKDVWICERFIENSDRFLSMHMKLKPSE